MGVMEKILGVNGEIKVGARILRKRLIELGFDKEITIVPDFELSIDDVFLDIQSMTSDISISLKRKRYLYNSLTIKEAKTFLSHLEAVNNSIRGSLNTTESDLKEGYEVDNIGGSSSWASYRLTDYDQWRDLPIGNVYSYIEAIKPIVRVLKRNESRSDRLLSTKIESLDEDKKNISIKLQDALALNIKHQESVEALEDSINESSEIIERIDEVIKVNKERLGELEGLYHDFKSKLDDAESLTEKIEEYRDEVVEYSSETKANARYVGDFISTINSKIEVFEKFGRDKDKVLDEYASIIEKISEGESKASVLIGKAKQALQTTTSYSLGMHFKEQYETAKENHHYWLYGSGGFMVSALSICVWVLLDKGNQDNLAYIISRLSVIPLCLAGVWFCSVQYVKGKRIIEDYAYKKVLALSIVGFRDELAKVSDIHVSEYITAVLGELHKYPLDSLNKDSYKEEIGALKSVKSDLMKSIVESTRNNLKSAATGMENTTGEKNKAVNRVND